MNENINYIYKIEQDNRQELTEYDPENESGDNIFNKAKILNQKKQYFKKFNKNNLEKKDTIVHKTSIINDINKYKHEREKSLTPFQKDQLLKQFKKQEIRDKINKKVRISIYSKSNLKENLNFRSISSNYETINSYNEMNGKTPIKNTTSLILNTRVQPNNNFVKFSFDNIALKNILNNKSKSSISQNKVFKNRCDSEDDTEITKSALNYINYIFNKKINSKTSRNYNSSIHTNNDKDKNSHILINSEFTVPEGSPTNIQQKKRNINIINKQSLQLHNVKLELPQILNSKR